MAASGTAQAQVQPTASNAELTRVLAQMDTAASKFKSAQAAFRWDAYQAVVQDHDIQSGKIYFEREGETTKMAAFILTGGSGDPSKIVVYDGKEVQFYQPAIKQMTVIRPGSNRAQEEAFLTLGFGGSGASLKSNWDVVLLGREEMDGVPVVKLDLKPKSESIKNNFTHVTIWVDPARAISLKQIFYTPSGDTRTCDYSDVKYNQPVSKNIFRIKTAPGTTVQAR